VSATTARPVGGKLFTPFFKLMLVFWALGTAAGLVRFTQGLGAATAMNDGYPWGIWIAFDVVVGTALACGGYAVALLVYVFNKGRYHPLVRPAILTSALGYSVAGVAITFDVGRYWALWKIPLYVNHWNLNSALLEVALCVMAYIVVLWIEVSPAFLEKWRDASSPALRGLSVAVLPKLEKALPFIIALGLLLPTMHQSSLGSIWMLAATKLHALWHTGWLPFLFLSSCIAMGYAMVVIESTFTSRAFGLKRETRLLGSLAPVAALCVFVFLGVRFADLLFTGRLGLAFRFDRFSLLFLLETAAFLAPALMLVGRRAREEPAVQLRAAFLLVGASVLYRFDTYLVAFQPAPGWSYFPSVGEILITLGLIATETMVYLFLVRKFPVLAGAYRRRAAAAPAPAAAASANR
jgi:Ni/Fe-hydrogenase subunit HybB-like protein